ncbi:MAG: hypothetical protein JJ899_06055 [Alphaproteobacteria bacterium]|nr:hypothetical protein [Alphaproteobacteria bacterium]
MTAEPAGQPPAPPPLVVRYNPNVQFLRAMAIFGVAGLCVFIPFVAEESGRDAWKFAGVLIAASVVWGLLTLRKTRDQTPQVIIDENGVYVREWHAGTVPWENIEYISHSSQIRRSLLASVTRTRRKPYLLFKFAEAPKLQPTAPAPLSWWQYFVGEFALQEPVIQQFGLGTPVEEILQAIQGQIAAWQARNPDKVDQDGYDPQRPG